MPDDFLGEMGVTCIVLHEGCLLTQEDVQAYARERLASFKVPRRVLFFSEEDLAFTGSSKIQTSDLRALASNLMTQ